jgi:hypothetical protein
MPIIAYVDSALKYGIKDGFLFPPWQEITKKAPPADGKYKNHLAYGTFSKWFGRMLEDVLPNQGVAFRIGLHMFRKTGYKFAIWRGALWEAIKTDACHVHDLDAKLYAGDSWSSQRLAHVFKDPENAVNQYQPSQNERICAIDNAQSIAAGVALSKLTQEFITDLPISPVVITDQRSLLDAAMTQTHTKPVAELVEEFSSQLSAEHQLFLKKIVQQQAAEERGRNELLVADFAALEVSTPTFPTSPPPATEAAAPTGGVDLVGRELVAKLTTLEEKVACVRVKANYM